MRTFSYLMERYNEAQKEKHHSLALILCTILNSQLEKFDRSKPFTPDELFNGEEKETELEETARLWTEVMGALE